MRKIAGWRWKFEDETIWNVQKNKPHWWDERQKDVVLEPLYAENDLLFELSAVSAAIGSVRWMDPPDGGDVSLAEQVGRMRDHIEQLEKFAEWVRTAPVANGCCCCGTDMKDHNGYEGHSPVDQWDYALGRWLDSLGLTPAPNAPMLPETETMT